jgi:class 3 adenylate cyclase
VQAATVVAERTDQSATAWKEDEVFEATVLLSELRGFSRELQQMAERDGAVWLNGMLTQMTEAVLRHDGVPVKYMGDAVLAFFAGAEHRDRAVRSALLGRQIMGENLSVGLHCGPIYLGRIGHPDYAARDIIGPTMIVAVRTQQWAGQSSTKLVATGAVASGLVSEELRARLSDPTPVTLKAVPEPILIHEIYPVSD